MRRREFITLLGGAAAAWPMAARAQQGERLRRIGVLMNTTAEDALGRARLIAFQQGLAQSGWTEGRNLRIDIRWTLGADGERSRGYAAELVALAPEVLVCATTPSAQALQQATSSIPIVFAMAADPVGADIVESLARPGGNTTGFMQYEYSLAGKWLELLKEFAPGAPRVAV